MPKTHDHLHKQICTPTNNLPKIVIIGAGFAGISLVKHLLDKPVQIILLDKHNYHQFQPLLYQVAISGLEPDAIVSPVRKLFQKHANLIYRMATVTHIDPTNRSLHTDIGYINYDYLVIATGSKTNYYNSKNIEKYSIGLKNINDAINIRSWMLQNLELAVEGCNLEEKDVLTNFAVIGGGPAGVEMAGSLAEFKKYLLKNDYPEIDPSMMKIYLIQSADRILPAMSQKSSDQALKVLKKLGIEVLLKHRVQDYDGETIHITSGETEKTIKAKTMIWTAGVIGNIIDGINPKSIFKGRYLVNAYNQILNHDRIFAIGDIALMQNESYPKGHPMVAQAAIQQGKRLAINILRHINNTDTLEAFDYRDRGSMATIGKKNAVADLKIAFLDGRIGWLLWSFIHLISIVGFRNKFKVGLNWIGKYFSYEKANQLIIRKYKRE